MQDFFKVKTAVEIAYNRVDPSGKKGERVVKGIVHSVSKTAVTIEEKGESDDQPWHLRLIPFERIVTSITPYTPKPVRAKKD